MERSAVFIRKSLENVMGHIERLPTPPESGLRVLQLLNDPDCKMDKVAQLISQDIGLTAQILKLSNSAQYGFSRPASRARDALMRIGVDSLKCILLSDILKSEHFKATPSFMELWQSALLTAFAAQALGKLMNCQKPEVCFTAGLVCDIGLFLIEAFENQLYNEMMDELIEQEMHIIQLEKYYFDTTHELIGAKIVNDWKFPPLYEDVISYHHHPEKLSGKISADDFKVLVAVHIANTLNPTLNRKSDFSTSLDLKMQVGLQLNDEEIKAFMAQKIHELRPYINCLTEMIFGSNLSSQV